MTNKKYAPNNAIKRLRKKLNTTQEGLGMLLEVNAIQICNYETGQQRCPLEIRKRLTYYGGGTERDYRQQRLSERPIRSNVKNPEKVNTKLRDTVYSEGLTPQEVCRLRGKSDIALWPYLTGGRNLSEKLAQELAQIIGCNQKDILPEPWEVYLRDNPIQEDQRWITNINRTLGTRPVQGSFYSAEIREKLREAMTQLPERWLKVIEGRFGFFGDKKTLEEIGQELGVSKERVRQIEGKAKFRLEMLMRHL